jgi:hypothetical protein
MSNDLHEKIIKDINEDEDENENVHFMKEHDMVFSKSSNGNIMAGGFTVSSNLLKNNLYNGGSPIENLEAMIGGNNENENIKSMAVPFGLFYTHNSNKNISVDTDVNEDNEISDEIYEQLLNKVNANDVSHEKSNKSIKSEKKKSRKNKVTKESTQTNHKKTAKSSHA